MKRKRLKPATKVTRHGRLDGAELLLLVSVTIGLLMILIWQIGLLPAFFKGFVLGVSTP